MSEKDELIKAMKVMEEGKRSDARAAFLRLEPNLKDPNLRLQLIDASLAVLDPLNDNATQLRLAAEGTRLAAATGLSYLQAHFMARTADFLMLQVGVRQHRRKKLKLAREWIEFATQADKLEYEKLTREINKLEKEIDGLLFGALKLAETSGNKRIQGYILLSKGGIESARYLQFKADSMVHSFRAKLWIKYEFMRYPFFESLMMFSNGDATKLRAHIKLFTQSFLRAVQLFEDINDSMAATAYHNLANDLKSAYRFRAAKKYLAKGKAVALKHNDQEMLRRIGLMEKEIAAKNRDIPDYLNRETRDIDSL